MPDFRSGEQNCKPWIPVVTKRQGEGRTGGGPQCSHHSADGLRDPTVHAVLTRHGMHRLAWLDRPTGERIRRYERARPGELVRVDVKKLSRIRDAAAGGCTAAAPRRATTAAMS